MTSTLLLSALIPYAISLIFMLPSVWKAIRDTKGAVFWICAAWVVMFIGQVQPPREDHIGGILTFWAYYQLAWVMLASLITGMQIAKVKITPLSWRLPVIAMFIYSFLGVVGAGYSPLPLLSIYKSALVFIDAFLVFMALSVFAEKARPEITLNICYLLISIVVATSAIGGLLYPEQAFQEIYGAIRGVMHGAIIRIHANELGLLSAILVIISIRRSFSSRPVIEKVFWMTQTWLGLIVLYNATARTSIAALFLALLIMTFLIRRLRPLLVALVLVGVVGGSYIWTTRVDVDVSGTSAEDYLRRGSSDEQLHSLSGRIPLWGIGIDMFKDAPVLGHGFNAGARFDGVKYGLPVGANMHSAHMEVLVNSGIAGYIAWVLMIVPVTWGLLNGLFVRKYMRIEEEWGLRVEAFLVMFVVLVRSFLGHVLVTHQFNFMIFSGLLIYLYLMKNRLAIETVDISEQKAQPTDRVNQDGILRWRQR